VGKDLCNLSYTLPATRKKGAEKVQGQEDPLKKNTGVFGDPKPWEETSGQKKDWKKKWGKKVGRRKPP